RFVDRNVSIDTFKLLLGTQPHRLAAACLRAEPTSPYRLQLFFLARDHCFQLGDPLMARIASRIRHEVGQYPAHPDTCHAEHHRFESFVLEARLVLTIGVAALVTTQISESFLR